MTIANGSHASLPRGQRGDGAPRRGGRNPRRGGAAGGAQSFRAKGSRKPPAAAAGHTPHPGETGADEHGERVLPREIAPKRTYTTSRARTRQRQREAVGRGIPCQRRRRHAQPATRGGRGPETSGARKTAERPRPWPQDGRRVPALGLGRRVGYNRTTTSALAASRPVRHGANAVGLGRTAAGAAPDLGLGRRSPAWSADEAHGRGTPCR